MLQFFYWQDTGIALSALLCLICLAYVNKWVHMPARVGRAFILSAAICVIVTNAIIHLAGR